MNTDPKKLTENLSKEQLDKVQEYQKIHMRLRLLKSQMADIQEETHDLIEELDKMREKENKNKDNG
jgi:septation ring formation regulator EzrA